MRFIKKEHHRMTSTFIYDIPDEDIVDSFGSVERFKEIISHLAGDEWTEPYGENPSDAEEDLFYEFYEGYDYDRDDDVWTELKGGFDVTFEYDDIDDGYDSDGELLN